MSLRIAFMGTPDFALPALQALIDADFDVCCVYSQPPRPAGRGQKETPSPVHAFAEDKGIEVRTPKSLKPPEQAEAFRALHLDAAVVAAYGLILPQALLDGPRLGCVNIHGSLLPRWRGAAPIQRAVMAGDHTTGITIMQMDAGLDTGPMILRKEVAIGPHMTAGELHDLLAATGAEAIVEALTGLADGSLKPQPQPDDGVTYADKVAKEEARIDWARPAAELDCMIRGLSPFPGAWFETQGTRIKVLRVEPVDVAAGNPGEVVGPGLTIACARGALRLLDVQRAGKSPTTADALLRGFPMPVGSRVE